MELGSPVPKPVKEMEDDSESGESRVYVEEIQEAFLSPTGLDKYKEVFGMAGDGQKEPGKIKGSTDWKRVV